MLNNLLRQYIHRETLISLHNLYTSILSLFSPNMTSTNQISQPEFDPYSPSTPVSYPIKTLSDLNSRAYLKSFHFQFNKSSIPLRADVAGLPNRRRMIVCHDMAGGYIDDKWSQGGSNADAYAIWHWYLIDVFIYFSHNFVTIPPPCWINSAHRHGVKVLGTFIVEWGEGRVIAEQFLETVAVAKMYTERLSELAVALAFDGWL